jgi:hypothetical protein
MKIILTLAEVKNIIATHLGLNANFEFEIENAEDRAAPILAIFEKVRAIWDRGDKIQSIKELRMLAPCYGLWEAKTVMENLSTAVNLARSTGAWPVPTRNTDLGAPGAWKQHCGIL